MRLEELRDLAVLREVARELARNRRRRRDVTLPHLHVPQRELRFGVEKKSASIAGGLRTIATPRLRLPPPSTHRVPHGILVSTM